MVIVFLQHNTAFTECESQSNGLTATNPGMEKEWTIKGKKPNIIRALV